MATAGSGDVLTGIIVGLLAQKLGLEKERSLSELVLESALAGVYLHGLAGDLAKASKTSYSLIAGDIQDKIPDALRELTG
jgi:NAD(P)H-hydrate epimerase